VEAGRASPTGYFGLAERLASDETRAVVERIEGVLSRLDRLERDRPGRAAFQAYARKLLAPAFARVGWDRREGESEDATIMRGRLIGLLGTLGDDAVVSEAKRRFAAFVKDPAALAIDLRGPVTRLAGRYADRATYDTLLALARKTTNTDERSRYYSAAASALDAAFARETLAIALTEELTPVMVGPLISGVADEHAEIAWAFVRDNLDKLAARQGPTFRDNIASNILGNFTDAAHAAELAAFGPAHETSGGRIVAARVEERILTDADFIARQLPQVDAWVRGR
jgi:aminopeptidase N